MKMQTEIYAAQILKELRLENEKSKPELAKELGITISMLNKYESGTSSLNIDKIQKLSIIFNVKPGVFFKWPEVKPFVSFSTLE